MARFVPAVGDIAGKIGNLVFSRGRYGPTIRRRAVPVNTRTTSQRTTRAFLSAASAYWKSVICPAGDANAWNTFAANFPLHQGKGTKSAVTVTGQAFSVAINTMRSLLGLVAVAHPPDTWGTDQPTAITATADDVPSLKLATISGVTPDATDIVLVKATGPLSPGVSFIGKSKYKFITAVAWNVLGLTLTNAYKAVFGEIPAVGSVIGISVQLVKINTKLGPPLGAPTACPGQPVFTAITVTHHV